MSPSLVLAVLQLSLGTKPHGASSAPPRASPHAATPAPSAHATPHAAAPSRQAPPPIRASSESRKLPPEAEGTGSDAPSLPTPRPAVVACWGCGGYRPDDLYGWRVGATFPVWTGGTQGDLVQLDGDVRGQTPRDDRANEPQLDPNAPDTCTPDDAAPVAAGPEPEATLYRWVDANGTVNYADADGLPEEARATATRTSGEPITVQPALHCRKLGAPADAPPAQR